MSDITTHRHQSLSVFQSLAEEVARRRQEKAQDDDEFGQEGLAPPSPRRIGLDNEVVQSATEAASEEFDRVTAAEDPDAVDEFPKEGPVDVARTCAAITRDLLVARVLGRKERVKQLEDSLEFSNCDPEWARTVTDYVKYFGVDGKKRKIPYVRWESLDDFVLETLKPDARIALIADWGTGTDEAAQLLEQIARKKPDVVIHLGDIYYSGTEDECTRYFLNVVNEVLDRRNTRIPVYTLTGNHDMYAAGVGYYGMLPELNPESQFGPGHGQPASYFSLRTTDGSWQILSLDTGLHDYKPLSVSDEITFLDPKEVEWHRDKVKRFGDAGGRTILLSHHPLFSAFSGIGKLKDKKPEEAALNPNLLASFKSWQEAGEIAAWFWGHEHNLEVYEPYAGLGKGRCIGHGAVPIFPANEPYKPLKGVDNPPVLVDDPNQPGKKLELGLDTLGKTFAHGYVILDLEGAKAKVKYFVDTDEAEPIYTETI